MQLTFGANGKDYRVVRTKSSGKLFEIGQQDKLIATGHTQVNIELSRVIGMPVERWLELRFVQQKAAAKLFEAGSAKLNLMVEELTGIRTLSQVIEILGADAKSLENKLEAHRELLLPDHQISALAANIADVSQQIEQALSLQAGEAGHLAELRAALESATNQVASSEAVAKKLSKDLNQKRVLERDLERARHTLAQLPAATGKSAEEWEVLAAELQTQLDQAKQQAAEHASRASRYTRACEVNAKAQADALFADHALEELLQGDGLVGEDADAALQQLNQDSADLQARRRACSEKLGEAQALINAARKAQKDGVCSSCQRPFDEDPEHQKQLEQQIAEQTQVWGALKDEDSALEQRLNEVVEEANDLAAHMSRVDAASTRKADTAAAADQALKEAHHLERELQMFESTMPKGGVKRLCENLPDQIYQARFNGQAERQRAGSETQAKAEIARCEQALAGHAEVTDEALEQAEAKVKELRRQERDAELQVNTAVRTAAERQRKLSDLGRELQRDQEKLDGNDALGDKVEDLALAAARVSSLRKHLRNNLSRYQQNAWDLILARASTWANDVTDGRITELRRTQDGAFEFIEDGEVAVVSDASGAQEAILGLAVHVGMAEAMPTHLDVFLADEPTADMDGEHSSTCLLGLAALGRQALVISHHRMDETLCSEVMEL